MIGRDMIDDPGQLPDHDKRRHNARTCAGEMRMRDGAGERVGGIGLLDIAVGSRRRTIASTCSLSA